MTRTDRHQVYDGQGHLVSEDLVEIPDAQVFREATTGRLRGAYQTLRDWADDAETTHAVWPTRTAAQKDAIHREMIRRLGVLCDGLADFIMDRGLAE